VAGADGMAVTFSKISFADHEQKQLAISVDNV